MKKVVSTYSNSNAEHVDFASKKLIRNTFDDLISVIFSQGFPQLVTLRTAQTHSN